MSKAPQSTADNEIKIDPASSGIQIAAAPITAAAGATEEKVASATKKSGCWEAFTSCFRSKAESAGADVAFAAATLEKKLQPILPAVESILMNMLNALVTSKIQGSTVLSAEQKLEMTTAANASLNALGTSALVGLNSVADCTAAAHGHVTSAIMSAGGSASLAQTVLSGVLTSAAPLAHVGVSIAAGDVIAKASSSILSTALTQPQKDAAIAALTNSVGQLSQGALNGYGSVEHAAAAHSLNSLNSAQVLSATQTVIQSAAQPLAATALAVGTAVAEQRIDLSISNSISDAPLAAVLSDAINNSTSAFSGQIAAALGVSLAQPSSLAPTAAEHEHIVIPVIMSGEVAPDGHILNG